MDHPTTQTVELATLDLQDARLLRYIVERFDPATMAGTREDHHRVDVRLGQLLAWLNYAIAQAERVAPAGDPEHPCDGPPGTPAGYAEEYRRRRGRHPWRSRRSRIERAAAELVDPDPPRLPAHGELDELRRLRPTMIEDPPPEVLQAARDAFVGSARADSAEGVDVELHDTEAFGAPCFRCADAPALPGRLLCAGCTEILASQLGEGLGTEWDR